MIAHCVNCAPADPIELDDEPGCTCTCHSDSKCDCEHYPHAYDCNFLASMRKLRMKQP